MSLAVVHPLPARAPRASRRQTRERLMRVGRQVFARKGLAGANLKTDILRPARVSVGSFYHQFRDKTDLLLAILEDHARTFRAMISEAHHAALATPEAMARHSYETVFRIADGSDDLFRIMMRERESLDARVRAYLRDSHSRWIASLAEDYERLGITDRDAAMLAAELISALTLGTVLTYLDQPRRTRSRTRTRFIDGLVRFTIGGVPALASAHPRFPGNGARKE